MSKPRVIAFYLPQFHPIPENDEWWGKGFTEWYNVGKAKSYYNGHVQPKVPTDLGYYDLRIPEVREEQVKLAREAGIEGFCYWHYWFGAGKELLEKPFYEVMKSGKPDFPFCLAWANESWKGFAFGLNNERNVLIEQKTSNDEDYRNHFYKYLEAFKDKRYIKVDGKLLFMVYKPELIPDLTHFFTLWNGLAKENGLEGFHFVANRHSNYTCEELLFKGFNAVYTNPFMRGNYFNSFILKLKNKIRRVIFNSPYRYDFIKAVESYVDEKNSNAQYYPSILCGWDHSPRTGKNGVVFDNFNMKTFAKHIKDVVQSTSEKNTENNIIFLKSWNEWAEGNFMEPDMEFGKQKIEVLRSNI